MKTKLTKEVILETIQKEADIYVKKANLYEQVKSINSELKKLYEHGPLVTSFGFKHDGDVTNKTNTGFAEKQNISYIAQLEKEMGESNEPLNEIDVLKQENDVLRKELEELKKSKNETMTETKS